MSNTENIDHTPREAEILLGLIAGTATSRGTSVLRPVMARIPEFQLSKVDAMARLAHKSRSSMIVHLLAVAIDELERAADPQTSALIEAESQRVLQLFIQNTTDREVGDY
jgi:hypothetical protein